MMSGQCLSAFLARLDLKAGDLPDDLLAPTRLTAPAFLLLVFIVAD